MKVDDKAPTILLRENYYSVVNGYKDPFLDRETMRSNANDVYLAGTEFQWLYALFKLDRELRQITFNYLIQAEAALKTATVYAFCEEHRGCSDYLNRSSFCAAKDMLVPKSFKGNKAALHSKNLNSLMGILSSKLDVDNSARPFIAHYMTSFGEVPLWVLANDLTFGNMSHFFQLMKRGDQNSVCRYLFETTLRSVGSKKIAPHDVLRAYDVLTYFRNLCAHDERLYCARKGNDTYATMIDLMAVALPVDTINGMKNNVADLLAKYEGSLKVITSREMGIRLGIC